MSDYFLADDLSGALDAAAAFHRAGRRVRVALSPQAWPETAADDVVGITTETRNCTAAAAAEAVSAAIAAGRARGARLVYKKIDSTLRGPVAAELAALAAAMPEARFLFAPANPSVGRTVREGRLLVHGVPLAETEFARDPVSPIRESSIRAVLGSAGGSDVTIPDTETEADLKAAVDDMASQSVPWVAIGSGALARPVAERYKPSRTSGPTERCTLPSSPILMIGGSSHLRNRSQAEFLFRERNVPVHEVNPGDLEVVTRNAVADVMRRGAVSLLSGRERTESGRALQSIASVVWEVARQTQAVRIFATGGETAFALTRLWRIPCLTFRAEIEPGVCISTVESGGALMAWAVKPGGFGDEQTWLRVYEALQAGYFI